MYIYIMPCAYILCAFPLFTLLLITICVCGWVCVWVCLSVPPMHFHSFTSIDSKLQHALARGTPNEFSRRVGAPRGHPFHPFLLRVNLQKMHRVSIVDIYIYNFYMYIYIMPCAHILDTKMEFFHAFNLYIWLMHYNLFLFKLQGYTKNV